MEDCNFKEECVCFKCISCDDCGCVDCVYGITPCDQCDGFVEDNA